MSGVGRAFTGAARKVGGAAGGVGRAVMAPQQMIGGAIGIFPGEGGILGGGGPGGFYVDPGQRPKMPEPPSVLNKDQTLKDPFKINAGAPITADQRGLEAFRERALGTGPSAWAQLQTQRQGLEQQGLSDKAARQSASSQAGAFDQLAMRGGLRGGQRERIATQGQRDLLGSQQDISRQGNVDRLNIGIEDERQRQAALAALPGAENAALDPQFRSRQMDIDAQRYNSGTALDERNSQRNADMLRYQEQMKAWAAANQANAFGKRAEPGKKG